MKNLALLATLVGLSACSLSQEKYQTDSITEECRLYAECSPEKLQEEGWEDQTACEEATTEATDTTDCTYDDAKAQECLDILKAADCETFAIEGYDAVCNEVYTCTEPAEEEGGDGGGGEGQYGLRGFARRRRGGGSEQLE